MGKLVSSSIPNLISGVSQQPWNVRLPTQAEEQVNCQSSVTDFLKRRPATRHLARIMDNPSSGTVAVHAINRDDAEQYIVTADTAGIRVFDLKGTPKTVRTQGTGAAYLAAAASPDQDLRFLTLNDYTFVLNRKAVVKTLSALSPKRQPEAIVFIKQASYNTTYQLTLNGNVYWEGINTISDALTFAQNNTPGGLSWQDTFFIAVGARPESLGVTSVQQAAAFIPTHFKQLGFKVKEQPLRLVPQKETGGEAH